MFYSKYVKLCNSVGKTPSAVALEIGIQKSTVTRWGKGSDPNDATKLKVADYFGVDVSEFDSEDTKKEPAANVSDKLPSDFYLLSDEQKKQVTDYIAFLLSQQ